MEGIIGVALRVSVMYVYALALLRLTGKRSLSHLSAPDAVVAFVVGDMFDDIFWADVALAKGIVGLTSVVLLHLLVAYGEYRSRAFEHVADGQPVPVAVNGRLVERGLRQERMRPEGLQALLHMQRIEHLDEVAEAYVEPSGKLGVLRREERKPADKRDLPALRELAA
jgi:uncharacterized membrane protein YcaP (DUF421 family)